MAPDVSPELHRVINAVVAPGQFEHSLLVNRLQAARKLVPAQRELLTAQRLHERGREFQQLAPARHPVHTARETICNGLVSVIELREPHDRGHLFKRLHVHSLHVLGESGFDSFLIAHLAHGARDSGEARQDGRTGATGTAHHLVVAVHFPHQQGLKEPLLLDGLGELGQALITDGLARVVGREHQLGRVEHGEAHFRVLRRAAISPISRAETRRFEHNRMICGVLTPILQRCSYWQAD